MASKLEVDMYEYMYIALWLLACLIIIIVLHNCHFRGWYWVHVKLLCTKQKDRLHITHMIMEQILTNKQSVFRIVSHSHTNLGYHLFGAQVCVWYWTDGFLLSSRVSFDWLQCVLATDWFDQFVWFLQVLATDLSDRFWLVPDLVHELAWLVWLVGCLEWSVCRNKCLKSCCSGADSVSVSRLFSKAETSTTFDLVLASSSFLRSTSCSWSLPLPNSLKDEPLFLGASCSFLSSRTCLSVSSLFSCTALWYCMCV